MAKQQITPSTKVWTHHPRGGVIVGYPSKVYHGLYGPERKIARTLEAARQMNGWSTPAEQVHVGDPPARAERV